MSDTYGGLPIETDSKPVNGLGAVGKTVRRPRMKPAPRKDAAFRVMESTTRRGTFNIVDSRKVVAVEMYLPRDTALAKCARRNGEAA